MSNGTQLMPSDIIPQVRTILVAADRGKGNEPTFLTSYQILDRLEPQIRDRLISERGRGGAGSGDGYSAPKVVSKAAESIPDVETRFLDCGGLDLQIDGNNVSPGNRRVVAIFRIRPE